MVVASLERERSAVERLGRPTRTQRLGLAADRLGNEPGDLAQRGLAGVLRRDVLAEADLGGVLFEATLNIGIVVDADEQGEQRFQIFVRRRFRQCGDHILFRQDRTVVHTVRQDVDDAVTDVLLGRHLGTVVGDELDDLRFRIVQGRSATACPAPVVVVGIDVRQFFEAVDFPEMGIEVIVPVDQPVGVVAVTERLDDLLHRQFELPGEASGRVALVHKAECDGVLE